MSIKLVFCGVFSIALNTLTVQPTDTAPFAHNAEMSNQRLSLRDLIPEAVSESVSQSQRLFHL